MFISVISCKLSELFLIFNEPSSKWHTFSFWCFNPPKLSQEQNITIGKNSLVEAWAGKMQEMSGTWADFWTRVDLCQRFWTLVRFQYQVCNLFVQSVQIFMTSEYNLLRLNITNDYEFNCSDPSWGGRNYILKWVFFVQSILADRYIYRRVKTGIIRKLVRRRIWNWKDFFEIPFLTGIYRGLNFEKIEWIPVGFYSLFPEFLNKTSTVLLKFFIFSESVVYL